MLRKSELSGELWLLYYDCGVPSDGLIERKLQAGEQCRSSELASRRRLIRIRKGGAHSIISRA